MVKSESQTLLTTATHLNMDNPHAPMPNIRESDDADSCSDSSDKTILLKSKCKYKTSIKLAYKRNQRNRYLQRSMRRFARLFLCAILMPMLLFLLFYLSIYTTVQDRHFELPDWSLNTSRNIAEYILPIINTTLIEPRDMCHNKTYLIIVICSSLQNFVQRQTIRETWGNTTEFNYNAFAKIHAAQRDHYLEPTEQQLLKYRKSAQAVRIVFFLGRSKYENLLGNETLTRLHNEAEQYNDIIQENFIDSYNNLTIKIMFALKYLTKSCMDQSTYVMKCDDDTFVNVPNLLHFLLGGTIPLYNDTLEFHDQLTYQVMLARNRFNSTRNALIGHLFCNTHPVNDVGNKWYMPYYMYPEDTYPKYLSGSGYVMSADVIQRLYDTALNTTLIYLEDVFITGICAHNAHIKRQHSPFFGYMHSKNLCTFKGVITQHRLKDDTMVEAWQFVSNYSIQCSPPSKYFKQLKLRKRISC